MTTSADLGIPYIETAQAQPDVTHNDALNLLQAVINGVISQGDTTPPGSPTEGDAYIVGSSATGAWAGRDDCIAAYFGTSWVFLPNEDNNGTPITPGARQEGLRVWVRDEAQYYVYVGDGASPETFSWTPLMSSSVLPELTVDNLHFDGNAISSLDTDGDIDLSPNGAGRVHLYRDSALTSSQLLLEEDGTGDAVMGFTLTGGQSFMLGIDNSASDRFKISASTALGTTDVLTLYDANIILGRTSSAFAIFRPGATSSLTMSGGAASSTGANHVMYGASHATFPSEHQWRQGSIIRHAILTGGNLNWRDSAGNVDMTYLQSPGALIIGATSRISNELFRVAGDVFVDRDLMVGDGTTSSTITVVGLVGGASGQDAAIQLTTNVSAGANDDWLIRLDGSASESMVWRYDNVFKMGLTTNANLLIGPGVEAASVTNAVHIFNGTAPTASVIDGVILYAEDVASSSELKVRDEGGTVTTLSPHNFSLIAAGRSDPLAWAHYSEHPRLGMAINADMFAALRLLERVANVVMPDNDNKLIHIAPLRRAA